jgi:hypothetical protein
MVNTSTESSIPVAEFFSSRASICSFHSFHFSTECSSCLSPLEPRKTLILRAVSSNSIVWSFCGPVNIEAIYFVLPFFAHVPGCILLSDEHSIFAEYFMDLIFGLGWHFLLHRGFIYASAK